MKALIFADVHFHKWPMFQVYDPHFETNRMKHNFTCLMELKDYALAHGIKKIIHVGDLAHTRGTMYVAVNQLIRNAVKEFKLAGLDLVLIAGNHDQANKSGTLTYIKSLEEYAQIVERFTIEELDGVKVAYIPFSESKQVIIDNFNTCKDMEVDYIFAHIPVAGSELVDGYRSSSNYEIILEEMHLDYFVGVMMGHYHKSQFLAPNCFYIGSFIQETLADAGQDKGFWEVDLSDHSSVFTKSLKFIKTHGPEFKQVTISDKKSLLKFFDEYDPDNFYKIIRCNSNLKIPVEELSNVIMVSKTEDKVYKPRVSGLDRMEPEAVLKAYVKHEGGTEIALAYGLSVLERIKKEKESES